MMKGCFLPGAGPPASLHTPTDADAGGGDAVGGGDAGSSDAGDAGAVALAELVLGARHSCHRFPDGRVKCWGGNGVGQLGLGDTRDRGDQPGEMDDTLPFVDLGQ